MALIVNEGLRDITRHLLGIDTTISLRCSLWINQNQPDLNDTMDNYAICTLPGYSSVNLVSNQWRANPRNGVYEYVYPRIDFAFNAYAGAQITIYGFLIDNLRTNHLIMVSKTTLPYTVPNAGGTFPVAITIDVSNCL